MAEQSRSSSPSSTETTTEIMESSPAQMSPKESTPESDHRQEERETSLETGIDRLLQRHRNELMYELRSLRHGQRPVTGQDNRRNVEDFFNQMQSESTSSASYDQQAHRPEAVLVEVNALVERRPVSNTLRRSGFVRGLENALQGFMSRASVTPTPQRQPPAQAGPTQAQRPTPAPRRPAPQDAAREESPLPLPTTVQQSRASEWVEEHVTTPPGEQEPNVWESLETAQRENLVMDISELVQQQLVTTALQAPEIRNRLESIATSHLQNSGSNGQRVQEIIQNLPRSYAHQRNDFSHLGIQASGGASSDDAVSVLSATAAVTVHNSQTNAMFSREMRAIKSQIDELKNMMRMSFNMQLDIQRAIRQEVAAAVNSQLQQQQPLAAVSNQPIQEGHCLICLENSVDAVLYQCGHMCLCYTCGQRLKSSGSHCPVCRAPIRDVIRSYKCSME